MRSIICLSILYISWKCVVNFRIILWMYYKNLSIYSILEKYMYTYISGAKIIIWLIICISIYMTIDPYADPLIALGGGMVGLFILSRWASFYAFYGWKKIVYQQPANNQMITESYKLSLLFGIYILINALLLVRHQWAGLIGIILFVGFVIIQAIVIPEKK